MFSSFLPFSGQSVFLIFASCAFIAINLTDPNYLHCTVHLLCVGQTINDSTKHWGGSSESEGRPRRRGRRGSLHPRSIVHEADGSYLCTCSTRYSAPYHHSYEVKASSEIRNIFSGDVGDLWMILGPKWPPPLFLLSAFAMFLTSLVKQEMSEMPRGVYFSSLKAGSLGTQQGRTVAGIPSFLLKSYQKNKQPGLKSGLAGHPYAPTV